MTTSKPTKPQWSRDETYRVLCRAREILIAERRAQRPSAEAVAYARRFVRAPERAFGSEAATIVLDLTAKMLNDDGEPEPPEGFFDA